MTQAISEMPTSGSSREVERLVAGQATSDGAGVKLTRVLTQDLQQRLDPFLMLDVFATDNPDDYIAGFPEHPHRGFETVTYMLHGRMRHQDSSGNEGLLGPGGVQWMTAGRGILHSEMPEQVDGRMEGFQLWLNLPAKNKMTDAGYQDLQAESIPVHVDAAGNRIKVIAGTLGTDDAASMEGAVTRPDTEPLFLDVGFTTDSSLQLQVPTGHHGFVYVYRGQLRLGAKQLLVPTARMAILTDGDTLHLSGVAGTQAIVVAGKPLREPIAQYGPFVMNTREELMQAVQDMREGRLV